MQDAAVARCHALKRKKLRRQYVDGRLQVQRCIGRKRSAPLRMLLLAAQRPNQRWSMDFVHDTLVDGGHFRILSMVDDTCTRTCACADSGS